MVQDESRTPGYIFHMGVSKHEALGLSLDLAWMWKDEKHMMASLKFEVKQGRLAKAI